MTNYCLTLFLIVLLDERQSPSYATSTQHGNAKYTVHHFMTSNGVMYRVCGLRLGPNFVVQVVADKKFYLRLTIEKKCIYGF